MINALDNNKTIVTNQRHYEQLKNTLNELELVIEGLNNGLSGDLLSINIKQSLFHLGLITGEVSTDDLLSNIFGKFVSENNPQHSTFIRNEFHKLKVLLDIRQKNHVLRLDYAFHFT